MANDNYKEIDSLRDSIRWELKRTEDERIDFAKMYLQRVCTNLEIPFEDIKEEDVKAYAEKQFKAFEEQLEKHYDSKGVEYIKMSLVHRGASINLRAGRSVVDPAYIKDLHKYYGTHSDIRYFPIKPDGSIDNENPKESLD